MINSIKKYPVLSYFLMAFAISWGALVLMVLKNGMPATMAEANAQLPVAIITFIAGPLVSGLVMTGIMNGGEGYRELFSRMFKWRVPVKWYAFAVLSGFLPVAVILFLSLFNREFLPAIFTSSDKGSILVLGAFGAMIAGICEEIGWVGFAVPRMRKGMSVLMTGLILGVLWGAWHIPSNDLWVIRAYTGPMPPALYATLQAFGFLIGQLPPFRVLMVWVYEKTGSLLIAMIMHFGLTMAAISFAPADLGPSIFILQLAVSAAMWLFAAAIVIVRRSDFI